MKWIKNIGLLLVLLVFALLLVGVDLWFFYHPKVIRTDGVIYGHRHGKESVSYTHLTLPTICSV